MAIVMPLTLELSDDRRSSGVRAGESEGESGIMSDSLLDCRAADPTDGLADEKHEMINYR